MEQILDCEVEGNSGEVSFMDYLVNLPLLHTLSTLQQKNAFDIMEKCGLFGETLIRQCHNDLFCLMLNYKVLILWTLNTFRTLIILCAFAI